MLHQEGPLELVAGLAHLALGAGGEAPVAVEELAHGAAGGIDQMLRAEPDDLPKVDKTKPKKMPRDVFAYVIHEGKVRAPAGAMELIDRVK